MVASARDISPRNKVNAYDDEAKPSEWIPDSDWLEDLEFAEDETSFFYDSQLNNKLIKLSESFLNFKKKSLLSSTCHFFNKSNLIKNLNVERNLVLSRYALTYAKLSEETLANNQFCCRVIQIDVEQLKRNPIKIINYLHKNIQCHQSKIKNLINAEMSQYYKKPKNLYFATNQNYVETGFLIAMLGWIMHAMQYSNINIIGAITLLSMIYLYCILKDTQVKNNKYKYLHNYLRKFDSRFQNLENALNNLLTLKNLAIEFMSISKHSVIAEAKKIQP